MGNTYIDVKCLEVTQPIGNFYIGVMDSRDLVRISFADIRILTNRELDQYLGIQRRLSTDRVEELKRYVETVDATFPTSIILAVSSEDAEFDSKKGVMRIRDDANVAKIIDGQHRIAGLKEYDADQFQVNVTIFVDMDIEDQAMVFATINLAQTKVNKSLVYDLYEYTKSRSPQKTSHNIARLLHSKEDSPFFHRIKVLGTATLGLGRLQTITQATFVEAMIKMISGDNKRALQDRDLLSRNQRPARASSSEATSLIFRNLFLDKRDADITNIVWNYFDSVRTRWSRAWNGIDIVGNILPRTNGFKALMHFLPTIYAEVAKPETVPSESDFSNRLRNVHLEDDYFTTENYKPGAEGENTLYKDLLKHLSGGLPDISG